MEATTTVICWREIGSRSELPNDDESDNLSTSVWEGVAKFLVSERGGGNSVGVRHETITGETRWATSNSCVVVVWQPYVGILCGFFCRVCPALIHLSLWFRAVVGVPDVLLDPTNKIAPIRTAITSLIGLLGALVEMI